MPVKTQRFVQLPTDTERLATLEFEASIVARSLVLPGGRAELLGALVALLHRYTEQTTIALDFLEGRRRRTLDVAVEEGEPVSSVIERAGAALAAAAEGPRSNVSFAFSTDVLVGDGYDVQFVLAQDRLMIAYNAMLFREPAVQRLLDSYATLLGAAVKRPGTPIERLPLLSREEIAALTEEQDSGTGWYPRGPVHRLFEALAKKQPEAVAASFQGQRLTYAELDSRSSRLAHYLVAAGVGPEVPVAVCVPPSLHVLVAMLAIWKARGLYLPLDPTHPEALIGRMLDEAKPRLVLTTAEPAGLTARFPQLLLDTGAAAFAELPDTAPAVEPSLNDPAYLFYTSGTTGKPKGVVATQGNLAFYVHSAAQMYGFRPSDVFASIARYTFSISLFELVSPLCCGGSLRILDRDDVLTPGRLYRALLDVTVLHVGPSLLGSLFRYLRSPSEPGTLPRVRHASSGGDMVSPAVMEEMKRVFPNAELFVIYGCTEISCMGTTFPIYRNVAVGRTFVGRPFPDVTLRVLDPSRNLVPFGAVGEICIAGKGIARGYLDRPELTAEKFVHTQGQRFYTTGDMGRLHPDGNLEILGRRDFQVQLRGIRIELAGIEKTVQELKLAAQCAVVARAGEDGELRLVAFAVKPAPGGPAAFRRALAKELPDYMVPHHLVELEAMPLTANGKLDRNRLKELPWEPARGSGEWDLGSDRERKIAEVFARVLGVGEVGVQDSFFDLGGDSLLGVLALDEIEKAVGYRIPPHVLFESGTARALATHAAGGGGGSKPILLNSKAPGTPLFILSGVHIYRELARCLDGRCAAYGVFAPREVEAFDPARGAHTVEDLARDYVQLIRSTQPRGPYQLLGYSFAGVAAYEASLQLQAAGEEVRFLALVDALIPEWTLGWRFRRSQLGRLWSAPARDTAAYLWRRVLHGRPSFGHGVIRFAGDQKLGPLEQQRDDVNREAAARYLPRMRRSEGPVTVIVAGERLRGDPLKSRSCGWDMFVKRVDVHEVDSDHFKMLTDEPYVSQMAGILEKGMRKVDAPA